MKLRNIAFNVVGLSLGLTLPSFALAQSTLNFQGISGLLNTPDASVLDYGMGVIAHDRQIDAEYTPVGLNDEGNDVKLGVGLLPGLEIVGRNVAPNDTSGGSDLSFNAKWQIPWTPHEDLNFAVGVMDLGGAANKFNTEYAVASWQREQFTVSLGAGTGKVDTGRLDGVFGGVEWRPWSWLSLIVENDVYSTNTGFRARVPERWMPEGWSFSSTWMQSSETAADGRDDWYGFELNIPLATPVQRVLPKDRPRTSVQRDSVSDINSSADRALSSKPIAPSAVMAQDPYDTVERRLSVLRDVLRGEQFERIRTKWVDGEWVIAFENRRFNRNVIDALGVAAAVVARNLPEDARFYLQLERYAVPVFGMSAEAGPWLSFLEGGVFPPTRMISAPSDRIRAGERRSVKRFVGEQIRYAGFRPTVTVKPLLASTIGTEFGVFDHSLAARADVVIPLWKGAAWNLTWDAPVSESKDFEEGGVFFNQRVEEGWKNSVVSQTIGHGRGFTTMFSAGRFFDDFEGWSIESRWQPGDGRHRLRVIATDFEDRKIPEITKDSRLLSWRYYSPDYNTDLTVTAGTFFNEDDGVSVDLRHHIGDVRLHIIYKESENTQLAGLGISIPLTPRKDLPRVGGVHVVGTPSWRYDVTTKIGEDDNKLIFGVGLIPTQVYNLRNAYFNDDRLSPAYVRANQERLREAWRLFGRTD